MLTKGHASNVVAFFIFNC